MKSLRIIMISSLALTFFLLAWIGYEYITFKRLQDQCAQNIAREGAVLELTFAENSSQTALNQFIDSVTDIQGVNNVELTTSDQALEDFSRQNADQPFIQESLGNLKTNPLPATATLTHSLDKSPDEIVTRVRFMATSQNVIIENVVSRVMESQGAADLMTKASPFWFYMISIVPQSYGASFDFYITQASLTECANR